jgi:hypothetical protein
MDMHIQYITDTSGARTAVQIPFKEWKTHLAEYRHLKQYSALKKQLSEAMADVRRMEKSKAKPKTLDEFLDEL